MPTAATRRRCSRATRRSSRSRRRRARCRRTATALRYLGLGFSHILAGLDHVAFLLCMLLVAARLSSRLWMITGFTLGHSITLSLSVLGLVSVRSAAVEALIGYTVALLAAEACLRLGLRSAPWQLWLVVAGVGAITWAAGWRARAAHRARAAAAHAGLPRAGAAPPGQ